MAKQRLAKQKDVLDIEREIRDIMIDNFDNPLAEKRVAEMYIKIDKARNRLKKKIEAQEEELNNGKGDILKYRKTITKYHKAENASIALLYAEINLGINHDKVEEEYKRLNKEVA